MSERDDDLDALYQRLGTRDTQRPDAAIRRAVLEEAARLATQRAERPPRGMIQRARRALGAALPARRAAAGGTLIAAALAGVMLLPQLRTATPPVRAPAAAASRNTTRPIPASQPAPSSPTAPAAPSPPLPAPAPSPAAAPSAQYEALTGTHTVASARARAVDRVAAASAPPAAPHDAASADLGGARANTAAAAAADESTLWHALRSRDAAELERALAAGASPEERDPAGRTPLLFAIEQEDAVAVRQLLARGADPNAPDGGGRRPLERARALGFIEIARALQAAGAR